MEDGLDDGRRTAIPLGSRVITAQNRLDVQSTSVQDLRSDLDVINSIPRVSFDARQCSISSSRFFRSCSFSASLICGGSDAVGAGRVVGADDRPAAGLFPPLDSIQTLVTR